MSWYRTHVFPWILDKAMSLPSLASLRQATLAAAEGRVLEVGVGTGLNFPWYPRTVQQVTAIDVNPGVVERARHRLGQAPVPVEIEIVDGQSLPMEDHQFDTLVLTWTLCSIQDADRALQEFRRVLKPGGRVLFVEHGLADSPGVVRWQHRLTPVQKCLADGCHLNRDITGLLTRNGFDIRQESRFYLSGVPRTHGFMYQGIAVNG